MILVAISIIRKLLELASSFLLNWFQHHFCYMIIENLMRHLIVNIVLCKHLWRWWMMAWNKRSGACATITQHIWLSRMFVADAHVMNSHNIVWNIWSVVHACNIESKRLSCLICILISCPHTLFQGTADWSLCIYFQQAFLTVASLLQIGGCTVRAVPCGDLKTGVVFITMAQNGWPSERVRLVADEFPK